MKSAFTDATPGSAPADPVIVVGAGPVGLRFVEALARLQPARPIKLFSGEPFKPYDRVKLSQLLARDIPERSIYETVMQGGALTLHDNCPIRVIDRYSRSVQDCTGTWHSYGALVLALGSEPFIPNIPNARIGNVFTFRDLRDTEALMARNLRSRHTVILGGGLLGLEAARAMLRNNTKVTVLQLGKHLMNRQLDAGASALLEARLHELGVDIVCNARVKSFEAEKSVYECHKPVVSGIVMDGGKVLACDTVIIATGIKPRIELARNHGLAVANGIRVNEHLQTSDPHIYAIGECCQFKEQVHGLVGPGLEQAAVAAQHIADHKASYQGAIASSSLKVVGLKVFSTGDVNEEISSSIQRMAWQDVAGGSYRACFTINGRLTGALAIGDWPEQHRVRVSIAEGRKIYFWNRLRFRVNGCLWRSEEPESIATWPAAMVVCNCRGVTRAQLSAARDAGARSCAALGQATGAGTVCGSCQPLLAQFSGDESAARPARHPWLGGISAVSFAAVLLYLLLGPLPFTHSVQVPRFDRLWLDALAKQISGFTLLGLAAVSLLMSLSKRVQWFRIGKFASWRIFHTVLGAAGAAVLLAHTGLNLGANLNRWLMLDFTLLILLGGAAGLVIAQERLMPARVGKQVRGYFTWAHTLLFWPLPALLAFHVLSVYYF